jgi:hypothetical protein
MKMYEAEAANTKRLKGIDVREPHPSFLPRVARGPMHRMIVLEVADGVQHPLYENGSIDDTSNVANPKADYWVAGGILEITANKVKELKNLAIAA